MKSKGGGQTSFRTAKDAGVTIVPKDKIGLRIWNEALIAKRQHQRFSAIAKHNAAHYDMRPRLVKP